MRDLEYHLLDVFTDTPFGGNQLAVFPDPGDLPAATMQKIARELNLSETTFVLPPQDPQNHYRLRIFTPGSELPFAGHPTIGTGYLLHQLGFADTELRLEEGVGLITVRLTRQTDGRMLVGMEQPTPQFGAIFEDRAALAALLSLTPDDLIADLPARVVSSGVPFLFVPVKNLAAMRRIQVRLDLWEQHLKNFEAPHLFPFTLETEQPDSTVHSRMFAPAMGIGEDPATGAASGPLGAYLLKYELVDALTGQYMLGEQGFEMGRPSIIHIHVFGVPGLPMSVSISGFSQMIGAGRLHLPD